MHEVYISGAISDVPNNNRDEFEKAEIMLRDKGYEVINPLKLNHKEDATHAEYMRTDLTEMLKCDGVYFLKSWRYSDGAQVEMVTALACGLNIDFEQREFEIM